MASLSSLTRSGSSGTIRMVGGLLFSNLNPCRQISVSSTLMGKRNVRKFFLGNKRGTKLFRRDQAKGKTPWAPIYSEVKPTGFMYDDVWHNVPEMIPEIIVPDLTDCKLKPYVSYKTADIYQTEFTAENLFEAVYKSKIIQDFKENKLDEHGNPLEPNDLEKLTPDEAWVLARKTGSDIFSEREPKLWECLEKSLIDEEPPEIAVRSDDLTHPSEIPTRPQKKFLKN
ncbi:unnamed protein product [Orchesella dallaii]|uniref:39S ribosomal protein L41, mitochondrial n=1 Tax=Orchesella dallaii TaxID=48710 RepID=A0ABP1QWE5_9HEXA